MALAAEVCVELPCIPGLIVPAPSLVGRLDSNDKGTVSAEGRTEMGHQSDSCSTARLREVQTWPWVTGG